MNEEQLRDRLAKAAFFAAPEDINLWGKRANWLVVVDAVLAEIEAAGYRIVGDEDGPYTDSDVKDAEWMLTALGYTVVKP